MSEQPSAPRTKTQVLLHRIERRPADGARTRPVTVPDLPAEVTSELSPAALEEFRETTLVVLESLVPELDKVELTDLRITRAWCRGTNTARITDKIATGRTETAEKLAVKLCGARRAMLPKLFRNE